MPIDEVQVKIFKKTTTNVNLQEIIRDSSEFAILVHFLVQEVPSCSLDGYGKSFYGIQFPPHPIDNDYIHENKITQLTLKIKDVEGNKKEFVLNFHYVYE